MSSLLNVRPNIQPPLDTGFVPAILANQNYCKAVAESGNSARMVIALERKDGCVARLELDIFEEGSKYDTDTIYFLKQKIKYLMWARGGSKLFLSGPGSICDTLKKMFSENGTNAFDVNRMVIVYDQPFEVVVDDEKKIPGEKQKTLQIGGYLDGCRIGFDLGASDYKLAAVIDGEPVFSTEIPWNPFVQTDPEYHYEHMRKGLKLAAEQMPRVDAIGGSAAGAYVDNQARYASLFHSIPKKEFDEQIKPIFLNLRKEWGVPFEVLNDGQVTALAGAMSLKKNSLLGIAMGSSEATGYVNEDGLFTGNYDALAYVPVDFNPDSVADPVSKDIGCGAQCFSQQAVNKLAPAAGFSFPEEMLLPERLKEVQAKANEGDENTLKIYESIGVYLAYSLPYYADLYKFENVLVLGRVTSGRGGEVIIDTTRDVMKKEFPEFAEKVTLHVPDEKSRRVGQAVAAASLPKLK
ncbi:ROK family protein [Verrucomicrobiota bacterium]